MNKFWSNKEIENLKNLYGSGVMLKDIYKNFPYRTNDSVKNQIKRLFGRHESWSDIDMDIITSSSVPWENISTLFDKLPNIPQESIIKKYRYLLLRESRKRAYWNKSEDDFLIESYKNGINAKDISRKLVRRSPYSVLDRANYLKLEWNSKKSKRYSYVKDEIKRELSFGFPMTEDALLKKINSHPSHIRRTLKKNRCFHIEKWIYVRRNKQYRWIPLWMVGRRASAEKPSGKPYDFNNDIMVLK